MKKILIVALTIFISTAQSSEFLPHFEKGDDDKPIRWMAFPSESGSIDTEVLYQGQNSFRLELKETSETEISMLAQGLPLNFTGNEITLRGMMKVDTELKGAHLLLRQDTNNIPVEFSESMSMETTEAEWVQTEITQPISANADWLVFGAVLNGPGTVWISNIEILIDGIPLQEVARTETNSAYAGSELVQLSAANIDWQSLTEAQVDELTFLTQLWGFIKYHHLEVATGQYDWDTYLVIATRNIAEGASVNDILAQWVDEIGLPENGSGASELDEKKTITQLDFSWFNHPLLNENSRESLHHILSNRYSGTDGYYAFENRMLLPSFQRERQYNAEHLDAELKFLGLARLWNVIEYWYPYRDMISMSWPEILHYAIPVILDTEDDVAYRRELQRLLAKLEDGHAMLSKSLFRESPFGECKVPVTVRHLENSWVVTAVYDSETELSLGDVIVAIENDPIEQLVEYWRLFDSASNEIALNYYLGNTLLTRPCKNSSLELTVARNGSSLKLDVALEPLSFDWLHHGLPGETVQILENNIVYARLATLNVDKALEAIERAQVSGKLIIDARGYPPEFVLYAIGNTLVTEQTEFARLAAARLDAPGVIASIDNVQTLRPEGSQPLERIAILVDETTLSQPEFSALAWRTIPGAFVVGSTTAGAIGNSVSLPLPNFLEASFTGLRVLDPRGGDVQRIGIVPDVYVKPTIKEAAEGIDPVIQRALELLSAPAG